MNSRRHFHTFDALRFFAFLKVFLLHLPITAFPLFTYLKNGGGIGVIFFFVLSGFLITYILLVEKKQSDTIDLKRFFLRRMLRIWPLYFGMVLFAFLTPYILSWLNLAYSNEGYQPNWLVSLGFLENYRMIATGSHPNVSPLAVTWSLCIEEHFYMIWGIVLYCIRIDKLPFVFLSGVLLSLICRYLFLQNGLQTIDLLTNLDFFVYGAVPAYLLVQYQGRLEGWAARISFRNKVFLIAAVLAYIEISPNIHYRLQAGLEPPILGISFAFILVCILPENHALKIGDRNVLSKLGRYTYGLYLFHTIFISLTLQVFHTYGISLNTPWNAIGFGSVALGLTILAGILSYHLFEKHFLALKNRLAPGRAGAGMLSQGRLVSQGEPGSLPGAGA